MLLFAENVSKYFGERTLFSGVDLRIEDKDAIGLIGTNGVGKTTLFRILSGEDTDYKGIVSRARGLKIGYTSQHVAKSDTVTAYEHTLSVFADLIEIENKIDELARMMEYDHSNETINRFNVLSERFEREGGLTFRSRARSALLGLGFSDDELSKPLSALSGGQKSKISLARLLVSGADLLFLDEPTNHLDVKSATWLEEYLLSFQGAYVVISHDRYFLDKVTNKTVEIEHGTVKIYTGGYTVYQQKKREELENEKKHYAETVKEIKRIEGIIEQQRQWSQERNYITIAHKQKSIDRLENGLVRPEEEERGVTFRFPVKYSGAQEVLTVRGLSCAFGSNVLFSDAALTLMKGDRAFLLGANGCGKTSLFKTLIGEYSNEGYIRFGAGITVGYFDQIQDGLHFDKDVLHELWDEYPNMSETEARTYLGGFLFKGQDVFKSVADLSGGERARLAILKIMLSGANLLLLDEPTNHLDIKSKEALETALESYEGTLLMISHDRYFINKLSTKVYEINRRGITGFNGNYNDYLEKRVPDEEPKKAEKTPGVGAVSYRERKERESRIKKLKGKISRDEAAVDAVSARIEELRSRLLLDDVMADYLKISQINTELEKAEAELESKMSEWENDTLELSEMQSE
ncbi:MAG: ATP-binding cassette domain-containing protein [Clostridia bacterium]|nr:ATP-binding cassette domain-containing protein [Clostridia bacterium]